MSTPLPAPLPGSFALPDGTWIRGRGVRRPPPEGPDPDFGLYLGVDYRPAWPHEWLDWPDFRLPRHPERAEHLLRETYDRACRGERVEVACGGGKGRTGTALAAIAILAGVPAEDAVDWVREHYLRGAVETPWQRRWVGEFGRAIARGEDPGPLM